jgi:chromosome condensin MukBEF ATPase and DNA-binding subunit MukB
MADDLHAIEWRLTEATNMVRNANDLIEKQAALIEQLQREVHSLKAHRNRMYDGQKMQATRLMKWRDAALWLRERVDHEEYCEGYTAAYWDRYDCTCGLDSVRDTMRGLLQ